jgi:uncharacterized protein (TIGR04255 family)
MKLLRSPLILVLAQIRFSPVLLMENYVPAIQEELRKQGFSWYRSEQIQQVFLGNEVKTELKKRWFFATRERREAVLLTPDFVVYETTQYDIFETFLERFKPVLELIKINANLEFTDQVGIRYIDLIRPIDGKDASDLLCENLRGLSKEQLDTSEIRRTFMIQGVTPEGKLFIRSFENTGTDYLPPDLDSTNLNFSVSINENEVFRILDIDHIKKIEQVKDFDPDSLIEDLWKLHEFSEKAFLASTTSEAIDYWKSKGN